MLRFLISLGALYAAFQIGREFGRIEAEVIQIPRDDRRPTPGNGREFGERT
ncbi:hypothetical protein [Mesorhizobium sp.]|uniref:hypothetical protein n=1 Tax=Mesorhizobium sp. TaxID=1871066 RepID=UPI00257E1B66|nr:hypothetical protein [Mesorhizobium sp.]